MKINFSQMRPSEKVILCIFAAFAVLIVTLVLFFWNMESTINQNIKKNEEELVDRFDQKFYELKKGMKAQQEKMSQDLKKQREAFAEDFYEGKDQLDEEFEDKKKAFIDNFKDKQKSFELGRERMRQNFKEGIKEFSEMKDEFPQSARKRYKMPKRSASKMGSTQ